jgi:hypothetical protein
MADTQPMKTPVLNARLFIISLGLLLLTQLSLAADGDKPAKLFEDSSEWKVTLAGPWRNIQRNSSKDAHYPAQLTYPGADGQQITVDIEVAPRALTRRRICDFPPLKVYFDKEKMKGTELRGNKSLKLVTYCDLNRKYEQYYIKEFLIYRIYNLITDYSFRVKPLMVDYQEIDSESNPVTRFSFLIEDADEVADRNDLEKLTIAKVPPSELHSVETSYFSLFQYMIGNLDFAATGGPDKNKCCHNAKIIGKGEDESPKYVIPYDFDSTGLVNAHYAAPPDKLKVRNVRQRLYRGFCAQNDTLGQAVDAFQQKKPAIMALFENDPNLNSSSRKRAISYLEDFYEVLDDPARFKREITDKCRG